MRRSLVQIGKIVSLSLVSLPQRRALVLSTLLSTALVIVVLLAFLTMAHGFSLTLQGASAADVAIVLRAGTATEANSTISREQVAQVASLPGVARVNGVAQISPELYVVVSGAQRSDGLMSNITFRGVSEQGPRLRPGTKLVSGRMFERGTNEVVVGQGLTRHFSGFDLGSTIRYGASHWQVVGVFESQGNVFESELWGDDSVVQRAFDRSDTYQLVRVKLEDSAAFGKLQAALEANRTLNLEARTEGDYYSEQVDTVTAMALTMGVPLSFVMALGALVGALNTMFGSIATRAREIATLRAMGFRRIAVFFATLIESVVITLCGAALAVAVVYLVFDGFVGSTLGSSLTQVVFVFSLSGALLGQAVACAVFIGLAGGLLPAQQAARAPIVSAMRG